MGTEMRIGIVAGMIIVVATSVYFIYGSDRSDGDLLLTPETTASSTDKTSDKLASKVEKPPAAKPATRVARANPNRRDSKPASSAVARPTARRNNKPKTSPVVAGRSPVAASARGPATKKVASRSGNKPAAKPRHASPLLVDSGSGKPAARGSVPVHSPGKSALGNTKRTDLNSGRSAKPGKEALVIGPNNRPVARKPVRTDPVKKSPSRETKRPLVVARGNSPIHVNNPVKTIGNRPASVVKPVAIAPNRVPPASGKRPSEKSWPQTYTIASGDTLSDVSVMYYGTSRFVDQILKANPRITGPRSLRIGRTLKIPAPDWNGKRSSGLVRLANHGSKNSRSMKRPSKPIVAAAKRSYTVRKGDTFYSISKSVYGSSSRWKDLFAANKAVVKTPSKLKPGMVLKVPA